MVEVVKNPILEFHNLTVAYDKKPAIWNVDCKLPKGKIIGVMGPNGSGKSTMMKSIMDLVPRSSGYVKVFNCEDGSKTKIAYVPQRSAVDWDFPINVYDTVMMGRFSSKNIFKRPSRNDKDIVLDAIRKVKLEDFVDRQISELSGGQQQRVFIARALAQQADFYLLDEPFAGVDVGSEQAIMQILKEMQANGKSIMVVHHDLQTAPHYFDWLVLMSTRLVASGPFEKVFASEKLGEAFGGQLEMLQRVGDMLQKKQHPVREPRSTK
ncbi:metal ABC transporter ATP-binding protein [Sediminitomix flava]|uniref:Manganese/zinc/iron transport system ATP-binding protein n=1 Tax=Sediminitomix flava TaxID=379075 RepID=A0A315Z766_SEDFL|nr:metal ABC transporter ATP-binding protein [Sediminitomix flava]PWJ40062.1 manganese/zinc/iron transport system ATP- binding protein [Sediminitomix flava]